MTVYHQLKEAALASLQQLFPESNITQSMISVNITKPEFKGDYTLVLFPFVKLLKQKPEALATIIGNHIVANYHFVESWELVSGFLNFTVSAAYWETFLLNNHYNQQYGEHESTGKKIMVEYSSPNTNKPLHFGHLRNIFLGAAVAPILENAGNEVIKANLINDRGIHICKSMVAWQRYSGGATPESSCIKGDHFVGDYYVLFNIEYKKEIAALVAEGADEKAAEKNAPIMVEAHEMLRKWEAGDDQVRDLWRTMNNWVYNGFDVTYGRLGITFHKVYYESQTYLLGKALVEEGLQKGVLYRKDDGSVWIDLRNDGLDEKLLLRGDGTSVYITQDLGTAKLKYIDYGIDQSVYVIGDEQNYHLSVLKLIMTKLQEPCAAGIYHLSYGMVELPTGKMKSREGTVVDADDMIDELIRLAKEQTELAGKTEGFTADELNRLYETIGLGALKFYLLRVEPKKKMIFNPKESIDLHGFTATFIQYAHARICSVLRREKIAISGNVALFPVFKLQTALAPLELKLMSLLEQYPNFTATAAAELNPSELCVYAFNVAQTFNSFYDAHSIAQAETEEKKQLRIMLVYLTASIIRNAMSLLGIAVPEKM
jgi:arginyl-tRNA synthetase